MYFPSALIEGKWLPGVPVKAGADAFVISIVEGVQFAAPTQVSCRKTCHWFVAVLLLLLTRANWHPTAENATYRPLLLMLGRSPIPATLQTCGSTKVRLPVHCEMPVHVSRT